MSGPIPSDPQHDHWDVIVVGTGMGGGTIGYELARLGRRVLFVEKGRLLHGRHRRPDEPDPLMDPTQDVRLRTGRWPLPLEGTTSFGDVRFHAPLGCSSAGSTGLYGSQLERFRPSDFRPRANFPDVAEADLPEEWPVSHAEMVPYYRRAEALYRVCGTPDPLDSDLDAPLREPPPLSPRDRALHDAFRGLGLHPYRYHVGFAYRNPCFECADICPVQCKSDAGDCAVVPALEKHGASILPECEVLGLRSDGARVTGVVARHDGRELTLRSDAVALAAGAFMTPVLMLKSASKRFPDGLGNRSGAVGRNLMLHTSDFLTVDPGEAHSSDGPKKALALNDFYFDEGVKLGTLQSAGLPIEPPFILAYLRYAEERDPKRWRALTSRFLPMAARITSRLFGRASLFATIVEDLPYAENRIVADPSAPNGMRFAFRYTEELMARNQRFRKRVADVLSPMSRVRVVTWGRNNINYGHVCGTCRFGNDPETSVLDRHNRVHDLDNLYVVDASFFPSSSGTNPSLTVAANALRVAGSLHEALG